MQVHKLKVGKEWKEYMCLAQLESEKGCHICASSIESQRELVESKLKPPKSIDSKCKSCNGDLVSFLDLPDEQKAALWSIADLKILVEKRIYCPSCRQGYAANYKR